MPALRHYGLIAALTILYFLSGKLGIQFSSLEPPSVTPVWPPAGVALAALIAFGYRVWPAIFIGAFLIVFPISGSLLHTLGVATGNVLEGVIATYLVNRFASGRRVFEHAWDILKFVVVIAFCGTTVSATIGVTSLTLSGHVPPSAFGYTWLTWWLGDTAGAILVTPLLLFWYSQPAPRWGTKRRIEAVLMYAAVIAVSVAIFSTPYPLSYLCFPVLLWAGFRFGSRETVTAVAILVAIATWATVNWRGPFTLVPHGSLLVLQVFTVTSATMALSIAALVAERAALLQRERSARADAEAANRTKDEFLAVLSHELRNPLSAIAGATAVLERTAAATREANHWRDIVKRETEHLARLIDDLLDIGRITARKLVLRPQPVDLGSAVGQCLRALQSAGLLQSHRIEVQSGPLWVNADPHRLNQIITNLLTNAIRYTPADRAIIVRTHGEGDWGVVSVEDTGMGIPPELLPRVFDLFAQGKQDLARAQGGLGIGLTLVQRLTQLHGGSVEAHSEGWGRGSTFTVRLPRTAMPAPAPVAAGEGGTRTHRQSRVLIVEDNTSIRESLRALLEIEGHKVYEAPDGEAGVDAALRLRPDVMLVDIGLPRLNGYDVARRVRAAGSDVRLIAVTGYGQDEDKQRAQEAGFDAFLLKPFSPERLQAAMEELFVPAPPAPPGTVS